QGLRQHLKPRAAWGLRLYGAHPHTRRGDQREALKSRLASATVGDRSLPLLAEPQSRPAHPLVEEGREPSRLAAARQRTPGLQEGARRATRERPTGIGP